MATPAFEAISTPESFLEDIDFTVLNQIYDEIEKKSGKVPNEKDWVTKGDIIFESENKVAYEQFGGIEFIRDEKGDVIGHKVLLFWQIMLSKPNFSRADALKTMMHEMAHLRGRDKQMAEQNISNSTGFHYGMLDVYVPIDQLGQPEGQPYILGRSINEAITEKIASEVLGIYLHRTGGHLFHPPVYSSYMIDQIILEAVINELSTRIKVNTETVWQAFVRMYLNGDESTEQLLKQIGMAIGDTPDGQSILDLLFKVNPKKQSDDFTNTVSDLATTQMLPKAQNQSKAIRRAVREVVQRVTTKEIASALGLS